MPLAAGIGLAAVLALVLSRTLAPARPHVYAGNGGIDTSPLYDSSASAYDAYELVLPAEFAPADPSLPAISGSLIKGGPALDALVRATRAIEGEGYAVGYALYNVATGMSVTYNADSAFYSASSLKGPYVTSLVRYELGDSAQSESRRIGDVIRYSSNSSYSALRDAYGNGAFEQMVAASGAEGLPSSLADPDAERAAELLGANGLADDNYEFVTPAQLLALWRQCYEFLSSDEPGAEWLAGILEQPETSAIRVTAGTLGTTWSKAGWYPADGAGYGTTVDAGVVRTDAGDLVLAVMTTKPEDIAALDGIVSSLVNLGASSARSATTS